MPDRGEGPATAPHERVGSLDVLRGIALLGMFLVHFHGQATPGGATAALAPALDTIAALFLEERFWAMFGILFGAGFALQFRRAEARGRPFAAAYVRRLLALAAFGLLTHAALGYHVLLDYALWGLPLLLFRRWPVGALVVALVLSASSGAIYSVAKATWGVAAAGEATYRTEIAREASSNRAFREANRDAQDAPDYPAVVAARLQHIAWFYVQPYSFLPVNTLTLFLIGVVGLRLGVFERPHEHRHLILAVAAFGIVSWAAATWLLPRPETPGTPLPRAVLAAQFQRGFGLVREMWLVFAYVGAVLLLVGRDPAWLRRLAPFGWVGRMALTNYIVQVAILDLAFSNYALALRPTSLQALGAALALFAVDAAASRWWLQHFRFGPFERIWRSLTYCEWQPLWAAGRKAVGGRR